MSTPTYDQAAIDAALAATEAAPPVHEAHQCQTGCGRLADAVMIQLATSTVDILCNPCLIAMMLTIAAALPEPVETVDVTGDAI